MVPDRGFLYIEIFQKSKGNVYMASIICKSWKIVEAEIKKIFYWKCQ